MTGYTRQSSAEITPLAEITAGPLNNEFDLIQTAFGAVTGHAHDGTTGNGPKINLTAAVSGILPVANGGTGLSSLTSFVTLTGVQTLTNKTLTTPTINGAALSGTVSGSWTATGLQTVSRGTATTQIEYLQLRPTDYAVGKPYLTFQKLSTATGWNIGLFDSVDATGTLNFSATILTANTIPIVTTTGTQTLTNKTLTSPTINSAALSGTVTGSWTATGLQTVSRGTGTSPQSYLDLTPTNYGVGLPKLSINKNSTATSWTFALFDTVNNTGTINFDSSVLTHAGVVIPTISSTSTLTNKTLTSPTINSGALSGTFSGAHIYTGVPTIKIGDSTTVAVWMLFEPTDYGVGKPRLRIDKPTEASRWNFSLNDSVDSTGTINFNSTSLTWQGIQLVSLTNTQTLTNKTFTSPTINAGTLSGTFSGTWTSSGTVTNSGSITGGTINATTLQEGGSQAYVRSNILGTVSESSGVPTGSVLERGTNANGEYVRYADGTLICTSAQTGASAQTATGNVFTSASGLTWTYPSVFIAAPVVSAAVNAVTRWTNVQAITATTATIYQFSSVTSAGTATVSIMAIGRWF